MNLPYHLLRLVVSPADKLAESIHIVTRDDVQWGSPVFRAPALPTPNQLSNDLPFTENLRPFFRRQH